MSPFTPKNWEDSPSTATPINAVALEDLETRVTDYAEAVVVERVQAKHTGAQAAIANGGNATFAFAGADDYDTGGYHDPATNNSRLTLPEGVWVIEAYCELSGAAAGGFFEVVIRRDGTTTIGIEDIAANCWATTAKAVLVVPSGTSYVEMRGDNATGVPATPSANCRFRAIRVGAT